MAWPNYPVTRGDRITAPPFNSSRVAVLERMHAQNSWSPFAEVAAGDRVGSNVGNCFHGYPLTGWAEVAYTSESVCTFNELSTGSTDPNATPPRVNVYEAAFSDTGWPHPATSGSRFVAGIPEDSATMAGVLTARYVAGTYANIDHGSKVGDYAATAQGAYDDVDAESYDSFGTGVAESAVALTLNGVWGYLASQVRVHGKVLDLTIPAVRADPYGEITNIGVTSVLLKLTTTRSDDDEARVVPVKLRAGTGDPPGEDAVPTFGHAAGQTSITHASKFLGLGSGDMLITRAAMVDDTDLSPGDRLVWAAYTDMTASGCGLAAYIVNPNDTAREIMTVAACWFALTFAFVRV